MHQATDASTPAAPPTGRDALRDSYERARILADRLVSGLATVPDTVEVHRELGTDVYGIRLHMGTGLAGARAVLAAAALIDSRVTRDAIERMGVADPGVWIECRSAYNGVPVVARALVNSEDATELTEPFAPHPPVRPAAEDAIEETTPEGAPAAQQPVMPLGSSVIAIVPAVAPDTAGGGE